MKPLVKMKSILEEQSDAARGRRQSAQSAQKRRADKMVTNKRAWLALKNALWWCLTSVFHLWNLNPVSIIRRRHAKLYYMATDDNAVARPRWTDVICNIILSDAKRKAVLLKWVQGMTGGVVIDNFTDSWHDGIALCSLLEGVSPGFCPQLKKLKSEYSKSNCQLGIKMAQKYLSMQKMFISPDIMATARPETEKFILHLVQLIKWRHQRRLKSKTTHENSSAKENAKHNVYEARGHGLTTAVVGKRATFTIFTENNDSLDLNIEIRGPNNERNCEKITKISPNDIRTCSVYRLEEDARSKHMDRQTSFHYMEDTLGNTVVRQRSLEDDVMNIIPFDYQFIDDQSFVVAYVPSSIGTYVIDIFSSGESIQGSPFEVTVTNTMTSWDKVSKKKLLMLNRRTYVEEVDRDDEDLHGGAFAEGRASKLDQPRLLRQYTVTKRRVIKRMITRNGQEIVITDHNSTPGTSRGSSVDLDHHDSDWNRKQKGSRAQSQIIPRDDSNNKAQCKGSANCLVARPFSPDTVSLCSFSRRSSGGLSDSNTSSSSDRHGDVNNTESNAEIAKVIEMTNTSDQTRCKRPAQDDNNTMASTSTSSHFEQQQNDHRFALQRAVTFSFGSKPAERNPFTRFSEDSSPKVSFLSADTEAGVNDAPSDHQKTQSNKTEHTELDLTENNHKRLHDDNQWFEKAASHPTHSILHSALVDENMRNKTQAVENVSPSAKPKDQCTKLQIREDSKCNDGLVVIQEQIGDINEKRPPHASNHSSSNDKHSEFKWSKPKWAVDKWTQVTSDEIKNETKWGRRVVRRRRRIPCSSEEDMARKIKDYHLKRATKKNERQVPDEKVSHVQRIETSREFGINKTLSEQPTCRVQRWLQNSQSHGAMRPARQLTDDSGISDETAGLNQLFKTHLSNTRPTMQAGTTNQQIRTDSTILPKHGTQNDEHSASGIPSESLTNVRPKETGTGSSGSVCVSDSELQCAPSILKQKRKLFAKTKFMRQDVENLDHDVISRIPKIRHSPSAAAPYFLRQRHACMKSKGHSLPNPSAKLHKESEHKIKSYFVPDSELMIKNPCVKNIQNLPCDYAESKHQIVPDNASHLQHVPNDGVLEHRLVQNKCLVIRTGNIPLNESLPSALSTPEEGYDGFGVLAEQRHEFLNEIRSFQDLALSNDTTNLDSQISSNPMLVNHNRGNIVVCETPKETKIKPVSHLELESDIIAELVKISPNQADATESGKPALVHVFGFSGQDISVDTDTSFPDDMLDKTDEDIHGYATEDDYWASSEISEGCVASGFGLKYGYVGIQNNFQVWVEDPDVGNLMVGVRGPRPHCVTETSTTYTGDNLYEVTYSVTMPGLYLVFIKWNNSPLHNSPFIVKIACVDDEHIDDD
ncbi:uncharacterized protein LOC121384430 [Gigantopelta aegis]|uniref:uncharacterized protein LOC121384430 n=1 Tax=Gigantopelta aegis TaxID=1735272 RepID=UPI001B88C03F|nr:uncharacterized protein LOC121384430 [Gigantopelta aegis]